MSSGMRLAAGVVALAILCTGCTRLKRFGYEGFGRDRWQQPDEVISSLQIRAGDRVADLGAGGGYFTFRLSEAVGTSGKVYAVDVDPGMIEYLSARVIDEHHANVEVVLAEFDDAGLPERGVDLIFTCNTYHHIGDRVAYFEKARRYLRPGGRLAVIEYRGKGWFQRLFGHATEAGTIRDEIEKAGYRLTHDYQFLSRQHFLVFSAEAG